MSNFWSGQHLQLCYDRKKQAESMKLQIPSTLDCKEVNVPIDFIAIISHKSKRSKQILTWKPWVLAIDDHDYTSMNSSF